MESLGAFKSVLRVRKILASWIQIRIWKNMLIQGAKYQQKNAKKIYSQAPNLSYWKKSDYKNILISEWLIVVALK